MSEITDLLFEIVDGVNAGLGYPVCNEPCEHGGRCTLDANHDGNHQTGGSGGVVHCEWERTDETD